MPWSSEHLAASSSELKCMISAAATSTLSLLYARVWGTAPRKWATLRPRGPGRSPYVDHQVAAGHHAVAVRVIALDVEREHDLELLHLGSFVSRWACCSQRALERTSLKFMSINPAYRMGMRPKRCAKNSSISTLVFSVMRTRSMASVGIWGSAGDGSGSKCCPAQPSR